MISPYSFPGLQETPEILKAMAQEKYITPEQVLETVSKFTFFSTAEIKSDWRKQEVVYARSLCYLLMSDFCFMSNKKIAKLFNRDHTVIGGALSKVREEAESETQLKADISRCVEILFSVYRVS